MCSNEASRTLCSTCIQRYDGRIAASHPLRRVASPRPAKNISKESTRPAWLRCWGSQVRRNQADGRLHGWRAIAVGFRVATGRIQSRLRLSIANARSRCPGARFGVAETRHGLIGDRRVRGIARCVNPIRREKKKRQAKERMSLGYRRTLTSSRADRRTVTLGRLPSN